MGVTWQRGLRGIVVCQPLSRVYSRATEGCVTSVRVGRLQKPVLWIVLWAFLAFSMHCQEKTLQLWCTFKIIIKMEPVPSWSCSQAVTKLVWHIPLLCVQRKTPGDGQSNCPKHVEFHSKNKFEKLVHLVALRNLSRCTVTWISSAYYTLCVVRLTTASYYFVLVNVTWTLSPITNL